MEFELPQCAKCNGPVRCVHVIDKLDSGKTLVVECHGEVESVDLSFKDLISMDARTFSFGKCFVSDQVSGPNSGSSSSPSVPCLPPPDGRSNLSARSQLSGSSGGRIGGNANSPEGSPGSAGNGKLNAGTEKPHTEEPEGLSGIAGAAFTSGAGASAGGGNPIGARDYTAQE